MRFVRDLVGGVAIIVASSIVAVAQNAVRGNPVTLILNVPTSSTAPAPSEPAVQDGDASPSPGEHAPHPGDLTKEQVKEMMESGTIIIVDARSEHEYEDGHIPGAVNIPYEKLVEYSQTLNNNVPLDATVVCYCRSVTCDLSDNLAQELRLMGYENVLLYRGGWDEWSEAGYPGETGRREQ